MTPAEAMDSVRITRPGPVNYEGGESKEPAPRPQIGDTKPAPVATDLKTITKRLQGGKVNWDEQIALLFDGHTCDRIVREIVNEQAAKQQKYFIQNKDRRVRVDVVTNDGVTQIEVRRRGPGE
jgi:hypothetical protein